MAQAGMRRRLAEAASVALGQPVDLFADATLEEIFALLQIGGFDVTISVTPTPGPVGAFRVLGPT